MTKIEWTDRTWNPATGCSHVSKGCDHCYARNMARRLKKMPATAHKYRNGFKYTEHTSELDKPLHWKKPSRIFVNSMSDVFHEKATDEFILKLFKVMEQCPQHTFQILTKRPERLLELHERVIKGWLPNIHLGVSIESNEQADRLHQLWLFKNKWHGSFQHNIKLFVSCEPLIGPVDKMLDIIKDWWPEPLVNQIIVGGESGHGARPMNIEWVREIQKECRTSNIPFFFKQWGAHDCNGNKGNKKQNGNLLDGKVWQQQIDSPNGHR